MIDVYKHALTLVGHNLKRNKTYYCQKLDKYLSIYPIHDNSLVRNYCNFSRIPGKNNSGFPISREFAYREIEKP